MITARKFWLMLLLVLGIGCEEILEKDISDKEIDLLTPADNVSTTEQEQLFWWEELEGADEYQVMIISPTFKNPTALLLDSLLTGDKLTFQLPTGDYEWCVRGVNSAYETEYACRVLHITN